MNSLGLAQEEHKRRLQRDDHPGEPPKNTRITLGKQNECAAGLLRQPTPTSGLAINSTLTRRMGQGQAGRPKIKRGASGDTKPKGPTNFALAKSMKRRPHPRHHG